LYFKISSKIGEAFPYQLLHFTRMADVISYTSGKATTKKRSAANIITTGFTNNNKNLI
jgi:hypothetical protein